VSDPSLDAAVPVEKGFDTIPYRVLNPIFGWKEFSPTARTICSGTYGQ